MKGIDGISHLLVLPCCIFDNFSLFFTASSISALSGAAPHVILWTDDKSYSDTLGCLAKRTIIGGTTLKLVGCKINVISKLLFGEWHFISP